MRGKFRAKLAFFSASARREIFRRVEKRVPMRARATKCYTRAKKEHLPGSLGEGQGELVSVAQSGGWMENRACIINGALCRNSRISEAEERRKSGRESGDGKGRGRELSAGTTRVPPRLRVDESGSHPLFRSRAHPAARPACTTAPMTSTEFNPSPTSLGGGTSPPVSSARD